MPLWQGELRMDYPYLTEIGPTPLLHEEEG